MNETINSIIQDIKAICFFMKDTSIFFNNEFSSLFNKGIEQIKKNQIQNGSKTLIKAKKLLDPTEKKKHHFVEIFDIRYYDVITKLNVLEKEIMKTENFAQKVTFLNAFVAANAETEEEKLLAIDLIHKANSALIKQHNLYIELLDWKDYSPGIIVDNRLQDDFNKMIDDSDIFVFFVGLQLTDNLEEEIRRAYKNYQEKKKPLLIYPFFKNANTHESKKDKDIVNSPVWNKRNTLYNMIKNYNNQLIQDYDTIKDVDNELSKRFLDTVAKLFKNK